MPQRAEAAIVEIVERTNDPDPMVIVPNEIRINGHPILAPADQPVVVHEVEIKAMDLVQVTLTLFAKRITVAAEPKAEVFGDTGGRDREQVEGILTAAERGNLR